MASRRREEKGGSTRPDPDRPHRGFGGRGKERSEKPIAALGPLIDLGPGKEEGEVKPATINRPKGKSQVMRIGEEGHIKWGH